MTNDHVVSRSTPSEDKQKAKWKVICHRTVRVMSLRVSVLVFGVDTTAGIYHQYKSERAHARTR